MTFIETFLSVIGAIVVLTCLLTVIKYHLSK